MAGTTFGELKRKVLLRINKADGRAILAAEEGINDALRTIARVQDFDELITLNTTTAFTVSGTKSYDPTTNWSLTRFKDIISIRLMDEELSRKLVWVPPKELDYLVPYTEQVSTGRPSWYTRRGSSYELFRIPDDAYALYIQHSQWPNVLTIDTTTCDYLRIDDVIINLAVDIAASILNGTTNQDWAMRARLLLKSGTSESTTRPDELQCARPFTSTPPNICEDYWLNPFIKEDPR